MQRNAWCARVVVCLGTVGWLAGCGDPEPREGAGGCPPENEIRGACAGIPQASVCEENSCVVGDVACTEAIQVASDAELQSAAVGALPRACIVLAPGVYGAVELTRGVRLLGRSAAEVTVGKVTVAGGEGAVIRGLTTPAIWVKAAAGAKIESVHVVGSEDTGVLVDPESSVALVTSTIERAARYGLFAVDPREVSLDRVIIAGSGGSGLWVASSSDCAAQLARPKLHVNSSIVRGSHVAGIAVFGADATLQGVDILATDQGIDDDFGKGGGGLSIASCSDVDAKGLRVHDSTSYGVLIDASKGRIGGMGSEEDVEIRRNLIGLAVQNIEDSFTLENAQLDENDGVGIGIAGESQGVVICRSGVSRTRITSMPVVGVGAEDVGDGLVWAERSTATITELALSENALASVLIDGEAEGALSAVTLSGGDERLGIVQQGVGSGGATPEVTGGTPPLQVTAVRGLAVPVLPSALQSNL